MRRTRTADDFEAIRLRMEELQRERAGLRSGGGAEGPSVREPDAAAHLPPRAKIPVPSTTRRPGSV
jgi:hypothetical protein